MSLKAFHILFITVSVLLCGGFGLWCFLSEAVRGVTGYQALGGVSLFIAVALVIYEIMFVRKMKDTK